MYHFRVTVTLASDQVFRIIMSRAYLILFEVGISNSVVGCTLGWRSVTRASVRRTYAVYLVQKSAAYAEITHQRRTADFWKFLSTAENGYRDVLSAEKNPPTFTRLRDLCPAFVLETHLFCLLTTLGRPTWLISRVLLTSSVTCM